MAIETLPRGMGSLQTICQPPKNRKYPDDAPEACKKGKCGCPWIGRWREYGRSRKKRFDSKKAGIAFLTDRYNARRYQDGRVEKRKGRPPLLHIYASNWLATQDHLAENTRDHYRTLLTKHTYPYIGAVPIDRIKHSTIKELIRKLESGDNNTGKPVYPGSVETLVRYVLRPIFRQAAADGWVGDNPCEDQRIKLPKNGSRYVPTMSEFHAIAATIDPFWRAAIYAMGGCGLREGEVLALTPESIQGDELLITRQWQGSQGFTKLKHDKHGHGRTVPLDPIVKAELERHISTYNIQPGQPLFRSPVYPDKPMTSQVMHSKMRMACAKLGLLDKKITAHNLRHLYASKLIEMGVQVAEVARILGHYDVNTTYKIYYHRNRDNRAIQTAVNGFLSSDLPENMILPGAHALASEKDAEVQEMIRRLEILTGKKVQFVESA